ncbi:hypothetical protein [Microseira wollei]|uniref:Uncharacterized protein n=1 Tax=Microseira wollei NIES-4236 TaxID=2530354 RepID=A0AAV3X759_9CYAN|nr:hypothetical protein [Microseira wollei]GET37625.1 hypothetical protein MiSe_23790 [Microseira wollei NIES-4236]
MTVNFPDDIQPENVIDFRSHSKTNNQNRYIDPIKADEYRSTGKCDDPRLKRVLKRLYTGEQVLSPQSAERLGQALDQAVEVIEKSASSLADLSKVLQISLGQSQNDSDRTATEIKQLIESEQKNLTQGIHRLLNIAQKYAKSPRNISNAQHAGYKRYQKLVDDITYIHRFLVEQAHVSVAGFELSLHPKAYFRRWDYLDVLPGYCRELANLTRRSIFEKVPGTQSDALEL